MILRFSQMPAVYEIINKAIQSECVQLTGGELNEYRKLRRQFCLLPNCDLYVDDDMDPELRGILLKLLRAHGFLEEKATVIVPDKHRSQSDSYDPSQSELGESDSLIDFESLLPDEHFDDGQYLREIEEILNRGDGEEE